MTISSVAPATPAVGTSGSADASAATGLGALFAGILGLGTASGDPGASGSAPADPSPADPALVDPSPGDPACVDPAAVDAGAVDPALSDPAPVDPNAPVGEVAETADPACVPVTGQEPHPLEPREAVRVAGTAELLAAAQIMAAAQVVPVTPVLAAALSLSATTPQPTPQPAGAPAGVPTGSTAVSAGDPVATVPSSAVPLAAPAVTGGDGAAVQPAPPADTGSAVAGAMSPQESAADTDGGQHRPETGAPTTPTGSDQLRARGQERAEPVNAPSAPQPTTSAPAVGPTARPEAAAAPSGPQATQQVTGQVFPEVTRLVTRGDGTQRITLKLSPEALGEVRVVLTVRDGDVQVRMVGSELAQQALRAGAPELQRLLDLAGATSSSIVVGDQGSAPDAGLHSGTDRNPDHRTAGTRDGDTSARDGSPGGPQQRPSTDPTATRGGTSTGTASPSGVDVTM